MANAIRANIPLSNQTNPAKFPDYEFREYPKQMLDSSGDPLIQNPVYLMTTPEPGRGEPEYVLRKGKKILIGGEIVVARDFEEEREFLKQYPQKPKIVTVDTSQRAIELEEENARLRAQLAARTGMGSLVKPRGRPKKLKAPVEEVVREVMTD